jgi:hypothetical protein
MTIPSLVSLLADRPPADGTPRLRRALPYLLVLVLLLLVMAYGEKFWDTNDDGHMAMIAHGYGLAQVPSPGLVFSNVVWGWIVMHLSVAGIQGYAIGQYAILWMACLAICYALYRSGTRPAFAVTAVLATFVPAFLETQFSITSGIVAAAGLALALACDADRSPWPMALAGLLLVFSALIRLNEFLLVMGVASPFYIRQLWYVARKPIRWRWAGMLGAAALTIAGCTAVDRAYYSGPEWQQLDASYSLAQPFTDFGLPRYYAYHPKLLKQYGLSVNDVQMVGLRFFVDENVLNAEHLGPLIARDTLSDRIDFNTRRWHEALRPFRGDAFDVLLVLFVVVAFACRRERAAFFAGLLCAGSMLLFWLLGRPGIIHVNVPLATALAVLAMISMEHRRHPLIKLVGLALLAAACVATFNLYLLHRREGLVASRKAEQACAVTGDRFFVMWGGGSFDERAIYRPTLTNGYSCNPPLYILSGLEYLPSNLEILHQNTHGRSLVQALLDGQDIYFLSHANRMAMLQLYMEQHYGAKLGVQTLEPSAGFHEFLVKVQK